MAIVINRVYTRTGDAGRSRLAGGQEIEKDAPRLEAFGTVDELNAVLGMAIEASQGLIRSRLGRIQNELFDLGGELATLPEDRHPKQILVSPEDIARLEAEIDQVNAGLPTLRSFILPGGGPSAATLHLARTVCRRAERALITLHRAEPQRDDVLRYVNRLGDWLFVMSRQAAVEAGRGEVLWKPGDRGAPEGEG